MRTEGLRGTPSAAIFDIGRDAMLAYTMLESKEEKDDDPANGRGSSRGGGAGRGGHTVTAVLTASARPGRQRSRVVMAAIMNRMGSSERLRLPSQTW